MAPQAIDYGQSGAATAEPSAETSLGAAGMSACATFDDP